MALCNCQDLLRDLSRVTCLLNSSYSRSFSSFALVSNAFKTDFAASLSCWLPLFLWDFLHADLFFLHSSSTSSVNHGGCSRVCLRCGLLAVFFALSFVTGSSPFLLQVKALPLFFLCYCINLKVHRLIAKIATVEQAHINGVVKIPIGDTECHFFNLTLCFVQKCNDERERLPNYLEFHLFFRVTNSYFAKRFQQLSFCYKQRGNKIKNIRDKRSVH